jgi:UDP-2,3-diacylglucosamine pyrophosphatase LpxH
MPQHGAAARRRPEGRGGLMIAVISDLHFEEEGRDDLHGEDGNVELSYPRNIAADPYRRLIETLAREAGRNGADGLRLVLAGDIFELYQTALWFEDENPIRPYADSVEEGSALESKILTILDAIADEGPVRETLELLQLFASGRYLHHTEEKEFPVPTSIEYIPGNHDRLTNATPAIRRRVRQLLGMGESGERFPNYLLLEDPGALIRHGHEYDPYNFAVDYTDAERIPLHIPREHYDGATLGDFITIDVVARLPVEYRRVHTPKGILADPVKRAVYKRLLEFEDVRPQSALLSFLLKMPKEQCTEEQIWSTLEPVALNILDDIHDHPFLRRWIDEWDKPWRPDRMDLVQFVLAARPWRKGISLTEAKLLGWMSSKANLTVVGYACREEAVQGKRVRSVVCGHTHSPTTELAAVQGSRECYFFDVGTWRHRIPLAHDESGFGVLKSLTYLILFGSGEDRDGDGRSAKKLESFDYWSGMSRRFHE